MGGGLSLSYHYRGESSFDAVGGLHKEMGAVRGLSTDFPSSLHEPPHLILSATSKDKLPSPLRKLRLRESVTAPKSHNWEQQPVWDKSHGESIPAAAPESHERSGAFRSHLFPGQAALDQ